MDEQNNEISTMSETKKNNSLPAVAIGVVALVALVGFLATRGSSEQVSQESTEPLAEAQTEGDQVISPTPSIQEKPEVAGAQNDKAESDVQTINLEAGSFSYSPKEIQAKVGQKVKLIMTSKDMMHDFNIDELNVKLPITKAGTTNTVEFTPDKAGTFEYYCSVGQHRKNGQVGTLSVE